LNVGLVDGATTGAGVGVVCVCVRHGSKFWLLARGDARSKSVVGMFSFRNGQKIKRAG
jgi:hypothetical protein